jgi:hypothetical protein
MDDFDKDKAASQNVNPRESWLSGSAGRMRLLQMVNASWMTQTIAVAVQLRLPELVSGGPVPAEQLGKSVDCDPASLLRLLRALTSLELLTEEPEGTFGLTELGHLLRQNVEGSLAAWAMLCGTSLWRNWGHLLDSVRTGQSARKLAHGADGFGRLDDDPEAARVFNRAMLDLTQPIARAAVATIDFTGVRKVVDVGGGAGALLATILAAHPEMSGVLFDLAHARSMAAEVLANAGVSERCEVATGSFFDGIPPGADAYLLKSILHDWDDERCATILVNCREAMSRHARLLVFERMMPHRFTSSPVDQQYARSDLNMLVGPGGRERTEAAYRGMLQAAGLNAAGVEPLTDGFSVLEATR